MENVKLKHWDKSIDVTGGDFENEMMSVKIYHFKNGDFTENSPKTKELAEKIVELLKEIEL